MTEQSKAAPFFGAAQTRQFDAAQAGKPEKNIFTSFADTPESALVALQVTPASSRAEDVEYGRSKQFPGLSAP